jgi:hypothetical protein
MRQANMYSITNFQPFLTVAILLFVIAMFYWDRKSKGPMNDLEKTTRLKVNSFVSKSVEYMLVAVLLINMTIKELRGIEVILAVGLTGIFSQAFANYFYRRKPTQ